MVDVCLLGTGGMVPLPDRWLTSLLIRYNGRMILIDCGEGTQIPLKMAGWGLKSIDVILFTHYHADHIAGLPGLLLSIGNSGRVEPITLIGPPDLKKVVEGLCVISPVLPYELKLIELSGRESLVNIIPNIYIQSIFVDHNLPCLTYGIEVKRQPKFDADGAKELNIPMKYWGLLQKGNKILLEDRIITPEMVLGQPRKGLKICYCTDTRPTGEVARFIKEADLFICEGMYGDELDSEKAIEKKHMTFSEAAKLASEANVKELWLTHFSPSLTEPQKYLDSAKQFFANVHIAADLFKKSLNWD